MGEQSTPVRTRPGRGQMTVAWIVSAIAAVLVDTAAVFGALQVMEFRASQLQIAAPSGSSTPSPGSPPDPRPSASASAPVGDPRVPASCPALYSRGMIDTLTGAGLVLQPLATNTRYLQPGTTDPDLRALLEPGEVLECVWLDNAGGDQSGVLTIVSAVTDDEVDAAASRLVALKMTRLSEQGGVRYFVEGQDADGKAQGESHFFRDGLWFATRWYGYGPYGYTADMVRTVFR